MKYLNQIKRQFGERIIVTLRRYDLELSKWGDPISPDADSDVEDVRKIEVEGVVNQGRESENDKDEGDVSSGSVQIYIDGDEQFRDQIARFGNNVVLPERNSKQFKIVSVELPANPSRFNHIKIVGDRV